MASGGVKRQIDFLKVETASQGEQVVEKRYAQQVNKMLKTVVGPTGTARKAATEIYSAGGKTGTAHKVGANGYEAGRYYSIFAGFAPADNPRVAIVVVVDDPKGKEYYGGEVAAPVFSAIVSDGLRLLNVPPDLLSEQQHNLLASGGGR